MQALINNVLGQQGVNFVPGFTRLYASQITKTALWAPIAFQGMQVGKYVGDTFIRWGRDIKLMVTTQKGEPPEDERWRICGNVITITAYAAVFTAATVYAVYAVRMGLLNQVQTWFVQLPVVETIQSLVQNVGLVEQYIPQTAELVYGGYALLGVAHLGKSLSEETQSNAQKIKHLFAGSVALATTYLMYTGFTPVRWSASSVGLLCLYPKYQALNILGAALTTDSLLYWVKPGRDDFDFASLVVQNLTSFVQQVAALSAVQTVTDYIFAPNKPVVAAV